MSNSNTNDKLLQTTKQQNITEKVLDRVKALEDAKALVLPSDFIAANALKAAWLILQDVESKDKKKALEVCSPESVSNALFEMVVKGLNPVKKQCYFIVRGNKLCCDQSYFGTIALAHRFGGLKSHKEVIIYEGDDFKYEIDAESGRTKVMHHKQQIENIDISKVRGAYSVYELVDGTKDVEIMTKAQIIASWQQGSMDGKSSAHMKFTDQMAKKTVASRMCKLLINTSNDSAILGDQDIDNNSSLLNDANTTEVGYEDLGNVEVPNGDTKPEIISKQQGESSQQPKQKSQPEPVKNQETMVDQKGGQKLEF